MNPKQPFKWRHFQKEIILLNLRWYLKYPLSYRNLESMMLVRHNLLPLTMKEVAERLGFDIRVISEHFPELCRAISDRYRRDCNRVRAMKIEECCRQVRQAVSTLIQKGEYPSEARVSQLISQPGYFRYKKVRIALKEAKSKY